MSNNFGGISQSNNGSVYGGMQVAQGDTVSQSMETRTNSSEEERLTQTDVVKLLGELEQMIQGAELPAEVKKEALTYLSAAKKATEKEEPNKERVKINLEGMTEVLEKTSKTVEAGTTLWTKAKPIVLKLAGWLGAVAAGSLLGSV